MLSKNLMCMWVKFTFDLDLEHKGIGDLVDGEAPRRPKAFLLCVKLTWALGQLIAIVLVTTILDKHIPHKHVECLKNIPHIKLVKVIIIYNGW